MKALILNGSCEGQTNLDKAAGFLSAELEKRGWGPMLVQLRDLDLNACRGCFKCWVETPGLCQIKDDAIALCRDLAQSGLLVLLTPLSFGGYGSLLKTALERTVLPDLLPFMSTRQGETHHPLRYGRSISTFAVGGLLEKDEKSEEIFKKIVAANALNLNSPARDCAFIYDDMTEEEIRGRMLLLASQAGVQK